MSDKSKTKDISTRCHIRKSIRDLDIRNKTSLVDLLFDVQAGFVSSRRAAEEILKQVERTDIYEK